MEKNFDTILVVGFNTRPLAYSLHQMGYQVYVVDFFGDLDLYPFVRDSIIITEELRADYNNLKENYSTYLTNFAIKLLKRNPSIKYLIISSGLDDAFDERKKMLEELRNINPEIINLNNEIEVIQDSRNTFKIQNLLEKWGYSYPFTQTYDSKKTYNDLLYPFIFKRSKSSGGLNIFKINSLDSFEFTLRLLKARETVLSDWQLQEYVDGIPVSCTVLGNGEKSELISINRQIIGEKLCNPPKEFMYCGNVVPANLLPSDDKIIAEISLKLSNELKLKGINGFDFVLKNHKPYFMEVNPRIPGSIRASECSMNLNLLDLHVKSFNLNYWDSIQNKLKEVKVNNFTTKLIIFAPNEVSTKKVEIINALPHVHDKSKPNINLIKESPVCSVLFTGKTFSDSYFGGLRIIEEINRIIQNGNNNKYKL